MTAEDQRLAILARTTARFHCYDQGAMLVGYALGYFREQSRRGDRSATVAVFEIITALFPVIATREYREVSTWLN